MIQSLPLPSPSPPPSSSSSLEFEQIHFMRTLSIGRASRYVNIATIFEIHHLLFRPTAAAHTHTNTSSRREPSKCADTHIRKKKKEKKNEKRVTTDGTFSSYASHWHCSRRYCKRRRYSLQFFISFLLEEKINITDFIHIWVPTTVPFRLSCASKIMK